MTWSTRSASWAIARLLVPATAGAAQIVPPSRRRRLFQKDLACFVQLAPIGREEVDQEAHADEHPDGDDDGHLVDRVSERGDAEAREVDAERGHLGGKEEQNTQNGDQAMKNWIELVTVLPQVVHDAADIGQDVDGYDDDGGQRAEQ